ncbi:hypothetical protein BDZ45DRAFT_803403 [Acephala macrosclerotiorum]|nr:hypothetical protein BDZ45DRAFT_803403 [Acephala macrosclerotiorum]
MSLPNANLGSQPPEQDEVFKSMTARNCSTKARNDLEWDSFKTEIRRIYIDEDRTLIQTMEEIQRTFRFKKSLRNWRSKLKEWGFDKNLTRETRFMLAKAEKRAREEGKSTEFERDGLKVPPETLGQFKKRRTGSLKEAQPIEIATPPSITYGTPSADQGTGVVQSSGPSVSPSPLDSETLVDIDEEMNSFISTGIDIPVQIAEVSSTTGLDPNPNLHLTLPEGGVSLRPPGPDHLLLDPEPSHIDPSFAALISLEALYMSFHGGGSVLSDLAFETYMDDVFEYLQFTECNKKATTTLFQKAFTSFSTYGGFDGYTGSIFTEDKKLQMVLRGLIRDPNHYRDSSHSQFVANEFLASLARLGDGNDGWRYRLVFGEVLCERQLPNYAIVQLLESIHEHLVYLKSQPVKVDPYRLLRYLQSSCRKLMGALPPFVRLDIINTERDPESYDDIDIRWPTFLYLVAILVHYSFQKGHSIFGEKIMTLIKDDLEKTQFSIRRSDWVVLFLELFSYYHYHDNLSEAVTILLMAYRITKSLLQSTLITSSSRKAHGLAAMDHPWQRAWNSVALSADFRREYPDIARWIHDVRTGLAGIGSEGDLTGPTFIAMDECCRTFFIRKDQANKPSASDLQDDKSSAFGSTYTESLSSGLTGLSLNYSSLFPSSVR